MHKPRLLVRPKIQEKQSRQDYLMEVAEANHLGGIARLCGVLGVNYRTLTLLPNEDLSRFFLGGTLPDSIAREQKKISGMALTRRGLGKNARICPICLRDGLPMPTLASYALTFSCPVHHVLLTEYCPDCKCRLSYMRKRKQFCDCGFDLRMCTTLPRPVWADSFYEYFAPWRRTSSFYLDESTYIAKELAVIALINFLRTGGEGFTKVHRDLAFSDELEFIEAMMIDWPAVFEEQYSACSSYVLRRRFHVIFGKIQDDLPKLKKTMFFIGIKILNDWMANGKQRFSC